MYIILNAAIENLRQINMSKLALGKYNTNISTVLLRIIVRTIIRTNKNILARLNEKYS